MSEQKVKRIVLDVDLCCHCPLCNKDAYWCTKSNREIKSPYSFAIPNWCELPDATEVIEKEGE
jgi:hypothetical protein